MRKWKRKIVLNMVLLGLVMLAGCADQADPSDQKGDQVQAEAVDGKETAGADQEQKDGEGISNSGKEDKISEEGEAKDADKTAAAGDVDAGDAAQKETQSDTIEEMDSEALFENADASGNIKALTEEGFSLTYMHTEEVEGGGLIGYTNEEEAPLPITSVQDTTYWKIEVDQTSYQEISRQEIAKAELKEEDSVLIFGEEQEDGGWKAAQVIVVIWK